MIGAFANILGSMIGASSQSATNDQMMRFQEETNKQQMQFNREEAQKNRDFQAKMANSEISRRIADMRASGLNPAFADSLGGATTPSGSQASANLNGSPNLKAPLDPLTASQVALNTAQADKLKADTSKTEKETDWLDVLNQQTINESDSNISVNGSVVSLNEEQKKLVAKQIESADQGIKNLKKQIELLDSQITKQDIDNFWASGRYSAEIEQLKSQTHLNDAECKEIFTLMFDKQALLRAQTSETLSRSELNKANTQLAHIDSKYHFWLSRGAYWDAGNSRICYELNDKFGEADKWVGYANLGLQHIENVGGMIMDYKSLGLAKRDTRTRERAQNESERHNRESEEQRRREWLSNDADRAEQRANERLRNREYERSNREREHQNFLDYQERGRHNYEQEEHWYRQDGMSRRFR